MMWGILYLISVLVTSAIIVYGFNRGEKKRPDDLYQHRVNEGLRDELMRLEEKVAYHKKREDYWRKRYFGERKGGE